MNSIQEGNIAPADVAPCDSIYWVRADGFPCGGVVTCTFGDDGVAVTDFATGEGDYELHISDIVSVVR